jgi:hypothetical protein
MDITALYWRDLKRVSSAEAKLTRKRTKTTATMYLFILYIQMNTGSDKKAGGLYRLKG